MNCSLDSGRMSTLANPTLVTPSASPSGARVVRAPRGNIRTCSTWAAEAAMRMLISNLDPEVADLVVYGGRGKAERNWECFDAIIEVLKRLAQLHTRLRAIRALQ